MIYKVVDKLGGYESVSLVFLSRGFGIYVWKIGSRSYKSTNMGVSDLLVGNKAVELSGTSHFAAFEVTQLLNRF